MSNDHLPFLILFSPSLASPHSQRPAIYGAVREWEWDMGVAHCPREEPENSSLLPNHSQGVRDRENSGAASE